MHADPCHAPARRNSPALDCPAVPLLNSTLLASSCRSNPVLPHHSKTDPVLPCHAKPTHDCLTSQRLAYPRSASTILCCQTQPHTDPTCQSTTAFAIPDFPALTVQCCLCDTCPIKPDHYIARLYCRAVPLRPCPDILPWLPNLNTPEQYVPKHPVRYCPATPCPTLTIKSVP